MRQTTSDNHAQSNIFRIQQYRMHGTKNTHQTIHFVRSFVDDADARRILVLARSNVCTLSPDAAVNIHNHVRPAVFFRSRFAFATIAFAVDRCDAARLQPLLCRRLSRRRMTNVARADNRKLFCMQSIGGSRAPGKHARQRRWRCSNKWSTHNSCYCTYHVTRRFWRVVVRAELTLLVRRVERFRSG